MFAGGAMTLIGWATGTYRLIDWTNNGIAMKANAAMAATCAGAALWIAVVRPSWRVAARLLASITAALGGLTLFEHLTGWDLGIDTLLFSEAPGALATTAPGRMGPPGSSAFLVLGSALLLITYGAAARLWASRLGMVALTVSSLSMLGYLYDASEMYSVPRLTGIAIQTATMICGLGLGILTGVPEHPPVSRFRDPGLAGMLARRALPFVLLLPAILGWFRVRGQEAGLYDTASGTAMLILCLVGMLLALLWWSVATIARYEDALRLGDRRKDEFLAALGHELRNPLAAAAAAIAVVEIHESANPQTRTAHAIIKRQIKQLTRLLDDLLEVSRITRGSVKIEKAYVTLETIIADAVETVRPMLLAERHELSVSLPSGPVRLFVDPARMTQVFANLLSNAIKYTPPGGKIGIEAHGAGDRVVVTIRDNGIGIEAEMLASIFGMFVQAHPAAKSQGGGLGIGLALARQLVEMNGGRIEARSEGAGRGTEIVVHLPQVPPSDILDEPTAEAPEAAAIGPLRILIADDNGDSAEALGTLFRLKGHDVRIVYDGAQACAEAASFSPNVAILDIGMPIMDGHESARRIRAQPNGRGICLIALSGWGQDTDRKRSHEAGFDHHFTKPPDFIMLDALLASLTRSPLRSGERARELLATHLDSQ